MYETGAVATMVGGVLLTREVLPDIAGTGAGVQAAQAALAVTGIAAGVYVAIALALILVGLVLRRWGSQSPTA
jgi:hypothetical protein